MAYSVILCGGSGTRLWPMSRKNLPKQFLRLYGDKSLLQETYLRVRELLAKERIFFVTGKEHSEHVLKQIRELENDFPESQVIIEPAARNTAGAIALAMKYLAQMVKIDETEKVLFLPSDHYVGKKEAYLQCMQKVLLAEGDFIGTIGIVPTKPEMGYGYIRKGEAVSRDFFSVLEFKEKPDASTAEKYVRSGEYVWNSGIYFFNARTFFQELALYSPEIAALFQESSATILERYADLPAVSVDYAISEKSKRVRVIEGDFGWSDIGSFDSLADVVGHNPAARHVGVDSENVYTYSSENRLIATIGVKDLIIVESGNSILVCRRGQAEEVRKIVALLKGKEEKEL